MLKLIPGSQTCPENEHELFSPQLRKGTDARKKILVYFIGGVTFAEIAAIRFLNNLFADKKLKFIIATTSIITGNRSVAQLRTAQTNKLDLQELK